MCHDAAVTPFINGAVRAAMTRARLAVDDHIEAMADAVGEFTWSETTATETLLLAARPEVRFIPFNQRQEGGGPTTAGVGADWLWWWISESDGCFGMLAQAKNFKRGPRGWSVDLGYRKQRQINDLIAASTKLQVPAVYILYCGPQRFREDLTCTSHSTHPDDPCLRAGVSIIPAMVAYGFATINAFNNSDPSLALDVYRWSVPLDDLVDVHKGPHHVFDLNLANADAELRRFLSTPQQLPRNIAKKIFAKIATLRTGQASLATLDRRHSVDSPRLFPDLPSDEGHFGLPYYNHVFAGLRREPPPYVATIAAGEPPPDVLQGIAGLVIVNM